VAARAGRVTQALPCSELLEHTADVRVRIRAESFGALATEAARVLTRIEVGAPPPPAGPWRVIEIRSADRAALLVDWLNELIFLAETERWVPADFEIVEATETVLRVRARGGVVEQAPARVKAATFSGLQIRAAPGGLEAEVVLDV